MSGDENGTGPNLTGTDFTVWLVDLGPERPDNGRERNPKKTGRLVIDTTREAPKSQDTSFRRSFIRSAIPEVLAP